jgi:hypothetical protein
MLRISNEMIESLRYKLKMFGIPIDGPADVFCDNQAVYKNTVITESTLLEEETSFNCIS